MIWTSRRQPHTKPNRWRNTTGVIRRSKSLRKHSTRIRSGSSGILVREFTAHLIRPFSKEFVLNAVSIVVKETTFKFDGQHYRSIQGTAMGTKMAPTYATLVMGYLERKLYDKFENHYDIEQQERFINNFKRFLDDCFLFWKNPARNLTSYTNF